MVGAAGRTPTVSELPLAPIKILKTDRFGYKFFSLSVFLTAKLSST